MTFISAFLEAELFSCDILITSFGLVLKLESHKFVIEHIYGLPIPLEAKSKIVDIFGQVDLEVLDIMENEALADIVFFEVYDCDH